MEIKGVLNIATYIILGLLFVGFIIGFVRSYKKSFVRFILLLLCLVGAIFLAPVVAKILMQNFVSGYVFNAFGFKVDFEEVVNSLSSSGIISDILSAQSTEQLILIVMNMTLNLAGFYAIFIVLAILSLIGYWIGCIVVAIKNRKNKDDEKYLKHKRLSFRLCGGVLGIFASFIFCFLLAVPLFGFKNTLDTFLKESNKESNEEVASAVGNSYVCSQLFYKEDEKIGQIETYLEKYADIKNEIDSSFIGKVSKTIGISTLGSKTFSYLTTVTQNGMKVSLTDEVVSLVSVYNLYKENFVAQEVDLNSEESTAKAIDAVELIYDKAMDSQIVKNYLLEIISNFRIRWNNQEAYLGIKFPVKGDFADIALIVIDKGFDTSLTEEVNNNIHTILNVARVANTSGLLKYVNEGGDVFEFIKNDETIFKDLIITLSDSKFEEAFSDAMKEMIVVLYDTVINDENLEKEDIKLLFEDANQELPEVIVWETEADRIQNIISSTFKISDTFLNEEKNVDDIIDNIDKLGILIDNARLSNFSKHFKIIIDKMINEKLDPSILGAEAMNMIKSNITNDDIWFGKGEYANFKFESMFNAVKSTASIANKIANSGETFSSSNLDEIANDLETILGAMVEDNTIKDKFSEILESSAVESLIPEGNEKIVETVKDIMNNFIDNTTKESIIVDVAAAKEIINIINSSNNESDISLGSEETTREEKEENANKILLALTKSDNVMNIIKDAVDEEKNPVASELSNFATNLSGEDSEILKEKILEIPVQDLDPEVQKAKEANKEALKKLFGITND